jgi:hypothetical protein
VLPARAATDSAPLVARVDTGFPPLARVFPIWRDVRRPAGRAVSVGERCTDGWRLGDERPRCRLGAVAAFAPEAGGTLLWRPLAGLRIVGYAVTACALVLMLLLARRRASRHSNTSGAGLVEPGPRIAGRVSGATGRQSLFPPPPP